MRFASAILPSLSIILFGSLLLAPASAQLVPTGQPIPRRANPPVVFLNGYQSGCTGSSDFASNFSSADKVLQTANLSSVYFDNCSISGTPSIEVLGQGFGAFLAGLKYDDGSTVSQVDIVAHSMGGLIVRSYLAGKQPGTTAVFQPPSSILIRKAIFLSVPNFGSKVASLLGPSGDLQTGAMSLGSSFLFDLNTWNQGTDDLRGVDVLSISANGGTGSLTGTVVGYDDGVVAITSSSVGFARSGRTRLVPYCHTGNFLVFLAGGCVAGTPPLNAITDPGSDVSRMLLSFLAGTADWQSIGQSVEQNSLGSVNSGILVSQRTSDDQPLSITNASFGSLNLSTNNGIAYAEQLPANSAQTLQLTSVGNVIVSASETLNPGTATAITLKGGPNVLRVIPAAAGVFPYSVAPGAFIGIYGTALAAGATASPQPYPTQLGGLQVTINGSPLPLQFAGDGQVNAIFPSLDPGLYKMTLKNSGGQQTLNVLAEAAVPAVFTQDASGTGSAAALNAVNGVLVTPSTPLHAGDFVSLYLTGLGKTTAAGGLDYANLQPVVTVGGKTCTVAYAGRNPVFAGLDQINCQIPAGLTAGAQPTVVTSGARVSNSVTLAIQ